MKKLIALLLCMMLALGLFAGCNNNTDTETTGAATTSDSNVVTIGVPMSANVTDWYDNEYTKWVQEQTGYTIEFVEFASNSGDYKSQLSTMTAGGMELPDMLWNFELGTSTYELYGEDGYLIDLAPYYNDREGKAKVFWDRMSELDEDYQDLILRKITSDDGAMYGYPSIETSVVDTMDYQVWINTTWLDALSLEKPTNRDELVEVLKAFKTGDPNGNGQADEIPMIGAPSIAGGDVINWIINMYIYNDDSTYFNVDENGKLYVSAMTDEYREALKFIRYLCDENLLNPVSFNASKQDMRTVTSPGEGDPRAGIWVGHLTIAAEAGHEGLYNYEALPLWSGSVVKENTNSVRCFITEDADDPDACWEILMCLSSEEGSIRMRYGVPGVHWDWAEEGKLSHIGIPAKIVMHTDVWGVPGNDSWKAMQGTILPYAEAENCAMPEDADDWSKYKLELVVQQRESYDNAEQYNPDKSLICPKLVLTTEEQEETSYERTDCSSIIKRSVADFCVGTLDPNNDDHWNNYLAQLQDMGIQTWLEQAQGVYERTIAE